MLRVPGTGIDLLTARARGGDVRMIYSPFDAVALAARNREREVVFFAVGFETTAPAKRHGCAACPAAGSAQFHAAGLPRAGAPRHRGDPLGADNRVQGFLAAGHVCAVMGTAEYGPIAARHHVPIVVTGF